MTHLEAPGLNVAGVALPGAPGIIVGHNQRIAWGITNLHFDVQDLYIEKLDDRTGRYLFRGQVEQARGEREIIRVKGAPNVEMTTWVTRHGPIFSPTARSGWPCAGPPPSPACCSIHSSISTARRTGRSSPPRSRACRDPDRTSCMPMWMAISATTPPAHCPGAATIAATFPWMAPRATSSGTATFRSTSCRASTILRAGMIVSANQNTFPENFPYPLNGNFAPPYRAQQIRALLSARNGWRAEDMLARAEGHLFGVQPFPGGPTGGRIPEAQRTQSRSWTAPSACCAPGTARWTRTWPRRS